MINSKAEKSSNIKATIREWAESILIAFILAMVIRTFLVQAFKIPTGSMRMTLIEGDVILVNKFIYGHHSPSALHRLFAYRAPERGDVVVFKYPNQPRRDFITENARYVRTLDV